LRHHVLMLAELALRALTPAAPLARRFGLLRESVGLWSRGRRQRKAWEPHRARCRAIIAEVAASLPRRRKVVVLGSGPARDIPLDALCASFEAVVLVDIVHLPLLRLKLWRQPKVSLLSRDLTGAMAWLAGEAEGRQDPLADLVADDRVDLVISVNLLSQLAWPIADWLEDNPARAATLPANLPARCIAWHLDDLARFKGHVCLISDVEMVERDRGGAIHDRLDLTYGVGLPKEDESWLWPVAPFGEAERDREYVHKVCVWRRYEGRSSAL
jgi:ethanolamine utilization microcompartment shell protein EutS